MKRHLENLLHRCSEEQFGQDAVEWAILEGHIKLTYDRDADERLIAEKYDWAVEQYQLVLQTQALLVDAMAPLFEQIQTFPSTGSTPAPGVVDGAPAIHSPDNLRAA